MNQFRAMLEQFDKSILAEFERIRALRYEPNVKGGSYEKVLAEFLKAYVAGILDFHTRAQLMDAKLEYTNVFKVGENNFDVVGTFKNSIPKLVFDIEDTSFVCLDTVALILEVKQDLTKSNLIDDLEKFGKLCKLSLTPDRYGPSITGQYTIKEPFKCLFYFDSSIDKQVLIESLFTYQEYWHMLVVLNKCELYCNPSVKFTRQVSGETQPFYTNNYVLSQMLVILANSLPFPFVVNNSRLFLNMLDAAR